MTGQHALAAVFAVVMLGWQFWPSLSKLFANFKLPSFSWGVLSSAPKIPVDIDVADLAALKIIQARFKRLNCAEGQAAVKVLFDHFFHEAPA